MSYFLDGLFLTLPLALIPLAGGILFSRGNLGSTPHCLWLAYKGVVWFALPLFFALHSRLYPDLKTIYIYHLAARSIRLIIEITLRYKFKKWSKSYAIAYEIFHTLLLTVLLFSRPFIVLNKINFIGLLLIIFLIFGTLAEIYFQATFPAKNSERKVEVEGELIPQTDTIQAVLVSLFFAHLVFQVIYFF